FDLAIREGRGNYDTELTRLFELAFYPVASPQVARRMRRRNGTLDWSRARLLHEVTYDYWPDWIAMAETAPTLATTTKASLAGPGGGAVRRSGRPVASDVADVDVARGLFFSHTMLALDAAVEGQGVALAPPPFAERELARGALEVIDPRAFVP